MRAKLALNGLKLVFAIFFNQIFIFSPNDSSIKNVFHFIIEKAIFVLKIFNLLVFFLPSHTFQTQNGKGSGKIYVMIGLHKYADEIFGITEKLKSNSLVFKMNRSRPQSLILLIILSIKRNWVQKKKLTFFRAF